MAIQNELEVVVLKSSKPGTVVDYLSFYQHEGNDCFSMCASTIQETWIKDEIKKKEIIDLKNNKVKKTSRAVRKFTSSIMCAATPSGLLDWGMVLIIKITFERATNTAEETPKQASVACCYFYGFYI